MWNNSLETSCSIDHNIYSDWTHNLESLLFTDIYGYMYCFIGLVVCHQIHRRSSEFYLIEFDGLVVTSFNLSTISTEYSATQKRKKGRWLKKICRNVYINIEKLRFSVCGQGMWMKMEFKLCELQMSFSNFFQLTEKTFEQILWGCIHI